MDASFRDERGTILAVQNGSADSYSIEGIPVLDGGAHPLVRQTARALCATSAQHLGDTNATSDFSYPAAGRARF
jgi:hypothetical protein